ncbi:hypothetical protein AB0I81_06115 [Nonomuraea sp. NPDC050404]|uniref:PIN-like domain-containing protein n=1 Tax=Nonomuraea sp. NPDC050404 TaxID=3155783 RepID=UPI0033F6A837
MTSEPPHASSWATPPEFYLDENSVSRTIRKLLTGLGYRVHSPAELYGSRDKALGAEDDDWLPKVGLQGWAVLATDFRIFERPHEYEAYLKADVPVFLMPAESKIQERVDLIKVCLSSMCSAASQRGPGVWRLTLHGAELYTAPAARKKRRGTREV